MIRTALIKGKNYMLIKKKTFLEDYVEVNEENIEIYEEIMKALYRRRTSNQDCGGD